MPTYAPIISVILSIVGTTASTVISLQQAQEQKKAMQLQAEMLEEQRKAQEEETEFQKEMAGIQSAEEQRQLQIQQRRAIAAIIAKYGAAGVTMAGTPLDVVANAMQEAELEMSSLKLRGWAAQREISAAGGREIRDIRWRTFLTRRYGQAGYKTDVWRTLIGGISGLGSSLGLLREVWPKTAPTTTTTIPTAGGYYTGVSGFPTWGTSPYGSPY